MTIPKVERLLSQATLCAVLVLLNAPTHADPALSAALTAQEHHACAVTLGLDPRRQTYADCIIVLDRSVASANEAKMLQSVMDHARLGCAERGLVSGTPEFGVCVVQAANAPVTGAADHNAAAN